MTTSLAISHSHQTPYIRYLTNDEALPILRQSGLDASALERIWYMADEDRDRRLSSKEFCVAFHIIVCVTKRGSPMPETLPAPLLSFLKLAPVLPPVDGAAAPAVSHVPAASPAASGFAPTPSPTFPTPTPTPTPNPAPSAFTPTPISFAPTPAASTADKISAEFDMLEPTPTASSTTTTTSFSATLPTTPAPTVTTASTATAPSVSTGFSSSFAPAPVIPASTSSVSSVPQSASTVDQTGDLFDGVDNLKAAARKAVAVANSGVEGSERGLGQLTGVRQKLATEKIALEASVANALAAQNE
eukprot:gene34153-41342_t